jgi:glycosyltransferase involved in cell wall biosynthesis
MPTLISACSITVLVPGQLASKMDLPLVILESLALKRPVIVSDQPPMDEALLGGGYGVPFGNIPALTEAMRNLLSDPVLYDHLAEQGYDAVRQLCLPEHITGQYRDIYSFLMEKKTKQAGFIFSGFSKKKSSAEKP